MRDLKLVVPRDCVASNTRELNDYALEQIRTVLKADTPAAEELVANLLKQWVTDTTAINAELQEED
jgi:hypothetical protein